MFAKKVYLRLSSLDISVFSVKQFCLYLVLRIIEQCRHNDADISRQIVVLFRNIFLHSREKYAKRFLKYDRIRTIFWVNLNPILNLRSVTYLYTFSFCFRLNV